jgi:hypothetical protein
VKATILIAAVTLCVAHSAVAQEDPAVAVKRDKQICRTQQMTGSLTRVRKTCHTQMEWDIIAASARKSISDISQQSGVTNGALDTPTGRQNAAMAGQ